MAKAKQASTKIKKKRWFKIFAPRVFGEKLIGESYVTDQQLLLGKHMTSNLMSLTGDMKKQNTNISFKVTGIRPDGASTDVISYEMVPASIKRLMKRGNKSINESFLAKTKDNITVRMKPLVFTRTKSKGSVSNMLRKAIKSNLTKKVSTLMYYNLINDLVSYKIQRSIREELNKIYPIRTSEIRIMKKISGEVKKEAPKTEEIKEPEPKTEETRKEPEAPVKKEIKPEQKEETQKEPSVKEEPKTEISKEEEMKQKAKDIKESEAKETIEKAAKSA